MRLPLLTAAILCLSTLNAHADDIFTLTGGSDTLIFTLPSSPVPNSHISGQDFLVRNVPYTLNGISDTASIAFYNGNYGGGFSGVVYVLDGAQLYSGTEANPTFIPGTYSLKNYNTTPETLTIASTAVTPEPSSIALLGTGMLGLFGVARRKFAR